MATENENKMDYGAFLADLEAKRAMLDNAIVSLKTLMAAGGLGSTEGMSYVQMAGTIVSPSMHGGEVPSGAFLAKGIPEATKLLLSIVKRKLTTREIADALLAGGMETTSTNFEGIVAAGLNRVSKNSGEIVRVKGAWALAAWYPAGIRSAGAKEKRTAKKKRALKTRLKTDGATQAKSAPKLLNAPKEAMGVGPQAQIELFFSEQPLTAEFSTKELAKHLGMKVQTAGLVASKLAYRGWLEKN